MYLSFQKKLFYSVKAIALHGLVQGFHFAEALILNRTISFRPKGYVHSVIIRSNTSDARVANTTFNSAAGYAVIHDNIDVIFDCGANVGYSAIFFAKHYPHSHIIALEPDIEILRLCEKMWLPTQISYRSSVAFGNAMPM